MTRKFVLLGLAVIVFAGCSAAPSAVTPAGFSTPVPNRMEVHQEDDGHSHVDSSQATVDMQVVLVSSELVLGPNRFGVGLIEPSGRLIHDAEVHFRYYDVTNPKSPVLESEADAVRLQTPDKSTTIFAHEREFKRAGEWGAEVQARFPDGTAALKRISFVVLAKSAALNIGDKAPAVDTPTAASVGDDLRRLTSSTQPNPAFYRLGLAQAIASGKPTVLLFSTPAFCQTRLCGPAYDIVSALQKRYGDAINFIHVEVYTGLPDPRVNNWRVAPAMIAFGLNSEPWVYLIDGKGVITYRVEGVFTEAEIERHLEALSGS